jgi:Tripartite tricarboxylate transporter TctB family
VTGEVSTESPKPRMPRADFLTGLVFALLGAVVIWASLEMPRFEERGGDPYTAPGLVPGALGAIILVLGAVLLVRAARVGGWRLWLPAARSGFRDSGIRRLVLAVVLCLTYAGGLVGTVPFWLATFVFITAFVVLFEWPLADGRTDRLRRLVFAPLFAAVIAAAVTLLFQDVFLVRLP